MEFLICFLIFNLMFFMVFAIFKIFSQRDLYLNRLDKYLEKSQHEESRKPTIRQLLMILVEKIANAFKGKSFTQDLQAKLIRAGIPLRAEEYLTIYLALIIVPPLLLFLLTRNTWLSVFTIVLGSTLPAFYIRHKKDSRLAALNQQLGDALVIMSNALRAGFGFQQAMDTVRRELPPPISMEFNWTLREMNLGSSQEEALLNLSRRVGSEDLDMVITGIIIQRQVGGNLAQILENISVTIRERARIKKEIRILTAQGRLSGWIIGMLPVLLIAIMLVINPAYFNSFIYDPRGMIILGVALVLEIIGVLIVRKIIDIDV